MIAEDKALCNKINNAKLMFMVRRCKEPRPSDNIRNGIDIGTLFKSSY